MKTYPLILILIALGMIGYIASPLLNPENGSSPEKEQTQMRPGQTNEQDGQAVTGTFSYITPKDTSDQKNSLPAPSKKPAPTSSHISKNPATLPASPDNDKNKPNNKPPFPITSLQLDQYEKDHPTGSPALEKAILFAIRNQHFEGLINLLETDLYAPVRKEKEIDQSQLKALVNNPSWNHALNLHATLQHFSVQDWEQLTSRNSEAEPFYYWLLTTPQALTQLLHNLTPQDDFTKALSIWQNIWSSETPEFRTKYLNLALSCALVFDKGNIKTETEYGKTTAMDRYTLFRNNAEARRLKTNISTMNVSDLVWVVDVPLSDSEIEWAVSRANFSRRDWGKAYGHIDYLMERAVNGEYPYEEYTLAEIQKHGGICGDQTYFSVNTAKANGIPAAGVTGSGDRGGHAWLAYKPNKNEWDTTTGRYESYSNGQSHNSQTNQNISEFDFILMSDRKMKSAQILRAKSLLRFITILVSHNHDQLGTRMVFEETIDTAPLLPKTWMHYIAFLESAAPKTTSAEWKKTVDTIERTFKKHPTMWLTARTIAQKHLWKDFTTEEIKNTQSRYRSEIARKFPTRGDIIRKVIDEQTDRNKNEKDFKDVRSFYRKTFRLFGEDTLNFRFIANLYFDKIKRFPNEQEVICDDIENYFSRLIDQESGDYFKAKTEISLLRMISNNYRTIGNKSKADKYQKEADSREKTSKKRAI